MSSLSRSKTHAGPCKQWSKSLHTPHTLSGVLWTGEKLFSVTVTKLCSSLSGHAQGFFLPSPHARGADSQLLSDGRKKCNFFKTLRNLIESSKCESRRRGGWEREQRSKGAWSVQQKTRGIGGRRREGVNVWGGVESRLTSTDRQRGACMAACVFKSLTVFVVLCCEDSGVCFPENCLVQWAKWVICTCGIYVGVSN